MYARNAAFTGSSACMRAARLYSRARSSSRRCAIKSLKPAHASCQAFAAEGVPTIFSFCNLLLQGHLAQQFLNGTRWSSDGLSSCSGSDENTHPFPKWRQYAALATAPQPPQSAACAWRGPSSADTSHTPPQAAAAQKGPHVKGREGSFFVVAPNNATTRIDSSPGQATTDAVPFLSTSSTRRGPAASSSDQQERAAACLAVLQILRHVGGGHVMLPLSCVVHHCSPQERLLHENVRFGMARTNQPITNGPCTSSCCCQ